VIVTRELWMADAACRDHPEVEFVPRASEAGTRLNLVRNKTLKSNNIARRICADCPVQCQCARYALKLPDVVGVWAGVFLQATYRNGRRRALQKNRLRAKATAPDFTRVCFQRQDETTAHAPPYTRVHQPRRGRSAARRASQAA
jgi:hypothetical protein